MGETGGEERARGLCAVAWMPPGSNAMCEFPENLVRWPPLEGGSGQQERLLASHQASLRSQLNSGGQHIASGLALFQVGCFLKTPRFPIWVVCSESHFSILFSLQSELLSDWRTERLFDLYYYDGLANQQEEIRLTVGETP